MAASQNGHVEVVDKLLQHGATVDLKEKVYINCKTLFNDHMRKVNHAYSMQQYDFSVRFSMA